MGLCIWNSNDLLAKVCNKILYTLFQNASHWNTWQWSLRTGSQYFSGWMWRWRKALEPTIHDVVYIWLQQEKMYFWICEPNIGTDQHVYVHLVDHSFISIGCFGIRLALGPYWDYLDAWSYLSSHWPYKLEGTFSCVLAHMYCLIWEPIQAHFERAFLSSATLTAISI